MIMVCHTCRATHDEGCCLCWPGSDGGPFSEITWVELTAWKAGTFDPFADGALGRQDETAAVVREAKPNGGIAP